jgi:hypothetical protein
MSFLMPSAMPPSGQSKDTVSNCGLRPRVLGGIPVEYKGATIPPPDKRRAYN